MLLVSPKARALIFDVDGTLVDTMPAHFKAWQEVAEKNGFIFPEDFFYEKAGVPTRKLLPMLAEKQNLDLDIPSLVQQKEDAFIEKIDQVHIIDPVVQIAREYYGRMPMSLGTGGRRYIAEMMMKNFGLDTLFDHLISADDVENHKPAPDTFLSCAQLMVIDAPFCQVFEDGEAGLEAARAAGMICTDIRPYLN